MAENEPIQAALKSVAELAAATISSQQTSLVVSAFARSNRDVLQSQAYLALSSYLNIGLSKKPVDGAASTHEEIADQFRPAITSALTDPSEDVVSSGLACLTALFQINWQVAVAIFGYESVVDFIDDVLDTFQDKGVLADAAHLIGQASGHKTSRLLVTSAMKAWLEQQAAHSSNLPLCAAAGTALIKLRQGSATDSADVASASEPLNASALVKTMGNVVMHSDDESAVSDAMEGMAYLSRTIDVAEGMSTDTVLMKSIFSKIPQKQPVASRPPTAAHTTLIFGVTMIILNSVSYRPRLSGEQAHIEKIRRMANAGAGASGHLEEQDLPESGDDAHVKLRGERLLAAGAVDALVRAVRASESKALRLSAGRALLHLIENKANRGKVLQSGGSKALMIIIAGLLPSTKQVPEVALLEPIQALAKLAITSSPVQVFGASGSLLDAIRPLGLLLTHAESTSLQRFEAMMALTNLASHGTEASERIGQVDSLLSRVEMLLLDDHTLTRRAAMELLCNLITNAEKVFERYAGIEASKARLQVIVALTDVDDSPTQLAASGALATITMSPRACQLLADLQLERHRVFPILISLVDPTEGGSDSSEPVNPGLVHRAVVCIRNLFAGIQETQLRKQLALEGDAAGLVRALVDVVKNGASDRNMRLVLEPIAETLKLLMASGVAITI
jgi:hypothetical protein